MSSYIDQRFESDFVAPLTEFIRIPNLSPAYDANYFTNGHVEKAIDFTLKWADKLNIRGLSHKVYCEEKMPPLVCIVIEGDGSKRNVLVYGHLDKQPHLTAGWSEGLGPVSPVRRGDKLYGRGSSDDGFAVFAALLAIKSCQETKKKLPRICITLETEEESGSANLLYLLSKMADVIQTPEICICLDTTVLDYSTLWLMTSLRGIIACNIKAEITEGGVHSGHGGGLVPETFSILRTLIDRLEDSKTGVVVEAFHTSVPKEKFEEAKQIGSKRLGEMNSTIKLVSGARFLLSDPTELYINNVWKPALALTGASGLPQVQDAGNVLRPWTEIHLALRLPPNADATKLGKHLKETIEKDPPHGGKVTVSKLVAGNGFVAPTLWPWVQASLAQAAKLHFGKTVGGFGGGGSIPFLNSMQVKFPGLQIVALGAAGPDSNAHNPDENLDLLFARKFLHCLEHLLADCGLEHPPIARL